MAAYLARFKGSSRDHTESDLRCYLAWCPAQQARAEAIAAEITARLAGVTFALPGTPPTG